MIPFGRRVSSPDDKGRIVRFAEYLVHFKPTRSGRFLVASGLTSGLISSTSGLAPTDSVVFTLFFVGLLSFVVNLLFRPRVQVECQLASRVMAGAESGGVVVVRNASRRTALDLAAAFLPLPRSLRYASAGAYVRALPPGGQTHLPVRIRALKRGVYPLPPLRVFSTFPFHFFRAGRSKTPVPPLIVIPRFHPLEAIDIPVGRLYQPGGFALTTNLGESPEYIGSRDYIPGDSVRRIDSRAWARLGRPAVREYQEEYYCRIALVLDTFISRTRRTRTEGFPELEAAISLSAAVADALTRGEYIIDIFAAGPELYTFRAGQNIAHLENVLDILSCVEACRRNPFDKVVPALSEEIANIATVICVFLDWDESRRELVRMAEEAGCMVKTIVIRKEHRAFRVAPDAAGEMSFFTPEDVVAGKVVRL